MSATARHRSSGTVRHVLERPPESARGCARCERVRPLRPVRVWDATFLVCTDCELDLSRALTALGPTREEAR